MDPVVATIVIALITATTSVVTALITNHRGRKRQAKSAVELESQLISKITAEAAERMRHLYVEIIQDVQANAAGAREEARQARIIARQAETRAAEAEVAAEGAEREARAMAKFLRELRPLIERHIPDPEHLLARLDRFAAATA